MPCLNPVKVFYQNYLSAEGYSEKISVFIKKNVMHVWKMNGYISLFKISSLQVHNVELTL